MCTVSLYWQCLQSVCKFFTVRVGLTLSAMEKLPWLPRGEPLGNHVGFFYTGALNNVTHSIIGTELFFIILYSFILYSTVLH